jgi:hypothetical protein
MSQATQKTAFFQEFLEKMVGGRSIETASQNHQRPAGSVKLTEDWLCRVPLELLRLRLVMTLRLAFAMIGYHPV